MRTVSVLYRDRLACVVSSACALCPKVFGIYECISRSGGLTDSALRPPDYGLQALLFTLAGGGPFK